MKILNYSILNFDNKKIEASQNSQTWGLRFNNTLSQDVVSFGSKSKKDKNKPQVQKSKNEQTAQKSKKGQHIPRKKFQLSAQTFDPKAAQARRLEKEKRKEEEQMRLVEQKLEYEHKKAELRKKYIRSSLPVRIKEQIISDKELLFILDKIKECPDLVSETFIVPENGSLLFSMSEKTMKKTLECVDDYQTLLKMIETPDNEGKIFMEKIPEAKLAVFHKAFEQMPTVLISAYLTENKDKQLPAHYLSLDGLKLMNEAMFDYPALLAQIYTHTDKLGNTPMHNRFRKGQSVIKEALAFQPETLTRIRKIRNKYEEFPETILKKAERYTGPYEETWKLILNEF